MGIPASESSYPLKCGDTTFTGRPHILIVHNPGEPYKLHSTHEWDDWDIIHYHDCPRSLDSSSWEYPIWDYTCWIGQEIRENGLRWMFKYAGTPIDKKGRYLFDFYTQIIRGYEWTEYDAGVALVNGQIDLSLLKHPEYTSEYDEEGILPLDGILEEKYRRGG